MYLQNSSQLIQKNGFSPVWILGYSIEWNSFAKLLPQWLHWNGFSIVSFIWFFTIWYFMCKTQDMITTLKWLLTNMLTQSSTRLDLFVILTQFLYWNSFLSEFLWYLQNEILYAKPLIQWLCWNGFSPVYNLLLY